MTPIRSRVLANANARLTGEFAIAIKQFPARDTSGSPIRHVSTRRDILRSVATGGFRIVPAQIERGIR
jgi:hypothetical protein